MGRFRSKRKRVYRPELLLQQLEERIVLDASVNPAPQDNPSDNPANPTDHVGGLDTSPAADAAAAGGAGGGDAGLVAQLPDSFNHVFGENLNVVLISSNLADVQAISDAAAPDTKVIVYDAAQGDVDSITAALQDVVNSTGQKIDNLAIVSHGTQGVLSLGAEQLQVLSLADQQASFAQWGQLLSEDAQIQFYACSLAGDSYGQALVDQISLYTSADVFASIDSTGGVDGNWDLEYASNAALAMHTVLSSEALSVVESELASTLVKDIYPGTQSGIVGSPYFTALGDKVIFTGYINTLGYEPWVSDGTTDGTINLMNINAGTASSSPSNYTVVGDTLFFTASDGTTTGKHGVELYKTDGTPGGTVMVEDINPGTASSSPANLFLFNGLLYFTANDGTNGTELWKSDGTEGGTQLVANLTAGAGSSTIANFCEMGGDLYFSFGSGTAARLYVMDGATEAVQQVASVPYGVTYIKSVNDTVIFTAQGPGGGYTNVGTEIWKSDGTDAGTVLLRDINPGGFASSPYQLTIVGSSLYFIANNSTYGSEVWVTDGVDGTDAHTHVLDIIPGTGTSSPNWLTESGGKLYFTARVVGSGTTSYLQVHDPLAGGDPVQLTTTVAFNLRDGGTALYFGTNDTTLGLGTELWKSDGTVGGTGLFEDVWAGSSSSNPANMTYVNGTLFFSAAGSGTGTELYSAVLASPSQPPVNTLGTVAGTITEGDAGINLGSAFTVSDPDAGDTLTVNISSTAFSGFSVNGVDYSSTLQIVGTQGVVNAALANLTGNLNTDFSGNAEITISTTDQNNQNDTDIFTLPVDAVPDAPTENADSRPVLTYPENYTQTYTAIPLQQAGFAVTDADPGDILTVTFECVAGEGFADISVTGYSGTYARTGTLVGTAAELNNIMQQFSPVFGYVNLEQDFSGVAQLHMTVTDSFGLSSTGIYTMNVSGVNDAPTATNLTQVHNIAEDSGPLNLTDIVVTDPDVGDTITAILMLNDPSWGVLSANDGATYIAEFGWWSISDTVANVNIALANVTFTPAADFNGAATIITNVHDSTPSGPAEGLITVNVGPVNDAPVNTVLVSATADEDVLTPITGISISDVDAGASAVQVTLSVANGTLQVNDTVIGGLTAADITGNASGSVVLNGTLAAINATLADATGVQYLGGLNYNGPDTLNVVTSDLGATGSGGALTDSDPVSITVNAVNDAPLNTVPVSATADSNVLTPITGISISDVDAGASVVQVTLSVANGTLLVNGTVVGGLTAADIVDNASGSVVLNGTLAAINATLADATGLQYLSALNYSGADTLTVLSNDLGATGSGGGQTDSDPVAITVNENLNDAPVISLSGVVQQTDPSGAVIFNAANNNLISISDVDAGTGLVRVTLTATDGTLTLSGVTGLTFDPGQDGTADATMTFTGTLTDVNAALDGMSFNRDAGYTGLADVTIAVNDQGNTGTGGAQIANAVETISVEPYDAWFAGFGTETGWQVYNDAPTGDEYFTHDMTLFWWHVESSDTWSFWNGTAWVSTDTLGNAPYDGGFGPPNEWFDETTGTYAGYDVYIHTAGQATYFSLDFAAPGATFWQLTDAGAWSYWDGDSWDSTGGFLVEPVDVWFHGYDGTDAGWDVYNHSATGDEYFTHDQTVFWWHVATGDTWQYWNGTAWVPTTGPQGVVPV